VTRIRTLVVDDEPLARQGLRVRLGREDDIDVIGEAEDGPSAVRTISALRPDLVFLDVQMPGFDGFEVLSRIAADYLPSVVFVTAYDRYALRAFGVHALDYLLKPIEHRRFQETLRRARASVVAGADAAAADRLRSLLEAREADSSPSTTAVPDDATDSAARFPLRFTVRDGDRYILLRVSEIDWAEAAANYLRLHAAHRTFQIRMTMSELERKLDARQFARIHRSTMVNLDRIASIAPEFHGDYQVVLTNGITLRMSRGYKDRLL